MKIVFDNRLGAGQVERSDGPRGRAEAIERAKQITAARDAREAKRSPE